jgi:hypothetical protein
VALAMTIAAPAALAAGNQPLEYLDEETGTTVTAVGRPLIFAHQLPGIADNASDYVTLAAAAVDQSGNVTYVLLAYFWSVGGSGLGSSAAVESLTLEADDRRIQLILRGKSARDLGIGVLVHKPPFGAATAYPYAIDIPTMRLIAESHQLTLRIVRQDRPLDYALFEDRRVALKEFVRRVDGKN